MKRRITECDVILTMVLIGVVWWLWFYAPSIWLEVTARFVERYLPIDLRQIRILFN